MGTRSPILSVAFWSFKARIWGFCRSLVLLSVARNVNVLPETPNAKLPNENPPPPLPLAAAAMFGKTPMLTEVGTAFPMVRSRSRLTCMTAISTTTSDLGLSMSASSFSARSIWSGVPRTIRASCAASS